MDPTKELVAEYRAEAHFNNTHITLAGPSRDRIEMYLRATIETKGATLKFTDTGQTTLLFLSTHKQGTEPIGWIALARVPTHLSVEAFQKNAAEAVAA